MAIRALTPEDWPAVREIYLEGVAGGDATFETQAPAWDDWNEARLPTCRVVAVEGDEVRGFAALSLVSKRRVYAGVAEVMIYVATRARGHGLGTQLMEALVRASEEEGIWTLQAGIFPENVASIRMHERAGFQLIGRFERIGRFHDGRWRDTVLMARRSGVVGVD